MSDIRKAIMERLGAVAEGEKAAMAIRSDDDVFNVLVEASDKGLDRHHLVREARRIRDVIDPHGSLGSGMLKHKLWPKLVNLAEQIQRLPAAYARPGAKAKMAASVRRGIDPKKGGQWITGTWDGGTWSAMVFSEPSEAYGIPEFPHISKLSINPKDRPGIGGVIVNYDRGWDIKPNTPELQKAYREIAQIATAEVNKAVKQGWYSRSGAKARMEKWTVVMPSIPDAGTRHFDSWEQAKKYVDSKMGGFTALVSVDGKRYALKHALGQWEKYSRPGAKAKMAISAAEARKIIATIEQRKAAATEWSPALDHLTKQRTFAQRLIVAHEQGDSANISRYSQLLEKAGWSRPGAKAKMDKSAALAIVGKAVSSVPAGPQRDALQKALIDYYDNTQASNRLLQQGKLTDATRFDVEAGRAVQIAIRVWDRMGKPAAELRGYTQNLERAAEFSRPGAKATAAKPDETEREDVKAGLKLMEKADQAVSDKIRTLIKEGKPQDQAVAIALDMKRRGEL